jgi:hypothetical protein
LFPHRGNHRREIVGEYNPVIRGCPRKHSGIIQPRNLSDILRANYVESSHAPANAAKDVVVEIFVRQPCRSASAAGWGLAASR